MLEYYRGTPSYHDEVKAVAPDRPSEEEMILFNALVRLHGPATAETRVLELGCGRCESAPKLMQMLGGGQYHAVEASADAAAFARNHYPGFNVEVGDISRLNYPDATFDIVFLNYVLEHTCEPNLVLDEGLRVLRPGGLLGMIVPVCDLPWLTPQSLRHRARNPLFLAPYALRLWAHFMRLRYSREYFGFPLVDEPFILSCPGQPFQPDDDQVYVGSTIEITKYLKHRGGNIAFCEGRDISTYIRNGRRPLVDFLRTLTFWGLRGSLSRWDPKAYTSTITVVARKS
jgi:SAM-dependent methyltransferase